MRRLALPLIAAFIGLSGSLATTVFLYRSSAAALDRVIDERLRGAGASAAQCLSATPPDSARLKSLMVADALEGAFLLDQSLFVLADATGPSGQRVDLLRIDPERVSRAFAGEGNTALGYTLGELQVAAAYFPVKDARGEITSVLTLEAGQAFTNARHSLLQALLMGCALSVLVALALAALAAGWGRSEQQRQQAAAEAARGETIREMAAIAAHEIRNPLGVIRGSIELMRERARDVLAPRDHEALTDVLGEVERLRRLTQDFLDFSADVPLQPVDVDVADVLQDAVRSTQITFPDIRIVTSIEALSPISADPARIRQVFENILTNAAQAQGTGQIDVGTRQLQSAVSVIVRDRGPGIPPELRDRIFDPLVTSKARGTGLGLALSRRIVERHGGRLRLVETSAQGATFEVQLPVSSSEFEREVVPRGTHPGR
jgi:signal transduction histidine kinase